MMFEHNRAAGSKLAKLVKEQGWTMGQLREAMEEVGADPSQVLGCGKIGCTVGADEGVVKITADGTEVAVWDTMLELYNRKGLDVFEGIPEIYDLVEVRGMRDAFLIKREGVEPFVMGDEFAPGPRTMKWLFGRHDYSRLPASKLKISPHDDAHWSFVEMLSRIGKRFPDQVMKRAALLDEEVRKLYVLSDIASFAKEQSTARKVYQTAYSDLAASCRKPFDGIGYVLSEIINSKLKGKHTWVTDVHPGNIGWRLTGKPHLLVFDWLSFELTPNGMVA